MTLKNVALFLVFIEITVVIPFHLYAENGNEPVNTRLFPDTFKAMYDRVPSSRAFYGKVIDQAGEGLEGAAVEIRWKSAEWIFNRTLTTEKTVVKTDIEGNWHAALKRPIGASVGNVEKEGYAYTYNKGSDSRDLINFPATKTNPVISVLRKKEPLTFLIISPSGNRGTDSLFLIKGTNHISRLFDLLAWESGGGWRRSATTNADLRIDAAFDMAERCWNFTYSITNGSDGIFLSDKRLYAAPATGYAPSVSVSLFPNNRIREQQKFLYVKSRMPTVYSQILIEYFVYMEEPPNLQVCCQTWTNPYGERSFEFDERSDSAFGLADSLKREALEAFAAGRYPEKPKDMGKLAEETRERVLREQAESNRRQKEWQAEQRRLKEAKNK